MIFYLLVFGSPITTHHPSSRFWRGKGLTVVGREGSESADLREEGSNDLRQSLLLVLSLQLYYHNHLLTSGIIEREREGEKKREGQLMRV